MNNSTMLIFTQVFLYFLAFFVLWFGAGLIISAVDKISRSIKVSRFALSFFLLGFLTSVPEMGVSINSILEKNPQIFVGNLLGGIVVIFLLIIPILAIFGNGINLNHKLDHKGLFSALVICATPSFLMADRRVGPFEAALMILLYFVSFYIIQRKQNLMESIESSVLHPKKRNLLLGLQIIAGLVIVFFVSDYIVRQTLVFSGLLRISPFVISVVVLSIGTNLPELLLAIRGIYTGKKDIAFGDYIGSGSMNTLLFGILVFLNGGTVTIPNHFLQRFVFTFIGLTLFYFFARSRNHLSRREGTILLMIYASFLVVEFIII